MSLIKRKQTICICENKAQISACVFATRMVLFLYFLNPKFPAYSHLLCSYSSVCVEHVRKQHCYFFHDAAQVSCARIIYCRLAPPHGSCIIDLSQPVIIYYYSFQGGIVLCCGCYCFMCWCCIFLCCLQLIYVLAHLSRRLTGELIVYPCSGVLRQRRCVVVAVVVVNNV